MINNVSLDIINNLKKAGVSYDTPLLIGVSGGPDSMALLDIVVKNNYKPVVCHMNYHHRPTANRDEDIVKNYCQNNNLIFYSKDFTTCGLTNFQDDARVARYSFFKDIYNKYNCCFTLIAHNLDDCLETYLMQLKRNNHVNYYGINKQVNIMGMHVIRPGLNIRKKQFLQYCIDNNITYGIDESNLKDEYTRNKIRHNTIEKLDDSEIEELLLEINNKNKILLQYQDNINKYINDNSFILGNDNKLNIDILRQYLTNNELYKYSGKKDNYYQDIINSLVKKKVFYFKDGLIENIDNKYKYYSIIDYKDTIINKIEYRQYDNFSFSNKGNKRQGLLVIDNELPLIVRKVRSNDEIELSFGHKKINRYFIDHKIAHYIRENTLVIENKNKEIIFVSGIGANINHYSDNANLFMIK